jgi:hypothetical protein
MLFEKGGKKRDSQSGFACTPTLLRTAEYTTLVSHEAAFFFSLLEVDFSDADGGGALACETAPYLARR